MATSTDHLFDYNSEDYYCPICCEVLQEPFLTECCGQHFCADCIDKAKRKVDSCPYCRTEPVNGIIDKHFNRCVREIGLTSTGSGDGQEESKEQQTEKPPELLDVPSSPENASGKQGSSKQLIDAREQRVDNVVQMTTTVGGTGLGGVSATLGGVAIGAAIGSVVPGVGTLIGGTIGGIAGGVTGVTGGGLIGFGVGKLTNKFRRNPQVKNALNRIPLPSKQSRN